MYPICCKRPIILRYTTIKIRGKSVESKEELSNKQTKLEIIRKYRVQGWCIKSKVKCIGDGEKPS